MKLPPLPSALFGLALGITLGASAGSVTISLQIQDTYAVLAGIDGDTLKVEPFTDGQVLFWALHKPESIRMLCINSPERGEAGYKEAGAWLAAQIAGGTVELQAGEGSPRRDRFSRPLAYVWVGGRNLNLEEVRAGLAPVDRDYPCGLQADFDAAEAEARAAKRGLWK